MLNVIKSDLYRMFRTTSFYIMQIIILVYNIIIAIVLDGESINNFIPTVSTNIPLFTGIFLAIFTYSDYKNGYIKNIAGIVPNKVYLLMSKLIIAVIYILISFAVHICSGILFSFIFAKHGFIYENTVITEILKCLGVHFVLQFAMAMIPIMIITLTRSNALACVISILASTSFISNMAYGLFIVLKTYHFIPESFRIQPFFISTYMSSVECSSTTDLMLKALAVSAVYIAVMVSVSVFAIKKKDVK